jgi:type IV pilus assembly protein PilA
MNFRQAAGMQQNFFVKDAAMKTKQGFTLLEMMIVLGIIAIIALIAMPSPDPTFARRQVQESMELIEDYKGLVSFYYKSTQVFLKDNKEAGIPAPDKLLGNYVDQIELVDGAFHIHFGNKAHGAIKDKTLSVRPLMVKGSPESPISWVCGNGSVPAGMEAIGENRTNLEIKDLPLICRL